MSCLGRHTRVGGAMVNEGDKGGEVFVIASIYRVLEGIIAILHHVIVGGL